MPGSVGRFARVSGTRRPRIGILGGMGPFAGVDLHRRIVEATAADRDQEHVEVVLFTDPGVPDRSRMVLQGRVDELTERIARSLEVLDAASVDIVVIACMTAHACLEPLVERTGMPILDAAALTRAEIAARGSEQLVWLLASSGALTARIFDDPNPLGAALWRTPGAAEQAQVANIIGSVKSGKLARAHREAQGLASAAVAIGVRTVVLGCTELSVVECEFSRTGLAVINPMDLLAKALVVLSIGEASG